MNMSVSVSLTLICIAAALLVPHFSYLNAQQVCGNIISRFGDSDPVVDCANPFNADEVFTHNAVPALNGQEITDGGVVTLQALETQQVLSLTLDSEPWEGIVYLYKNQGEDFQEIALASYTFPEEIAITATGTYTAVIVVNVDPPILTLKAQLWERLVHFFVPKVFAYFGDSSDVKQITFEIALEEIVVPEGKPSIFFIPGIKGSNLYKETFIGEDQVWIPSINNDVEQLEMNDNGESVEEIYTRDIVESAVFTDIYKSFIEYLVEGKNSGTISDWASFPYDWRYDVINVVENGTQYENEIRFPTLELEKLASSTNSKVTIIAHSNGGLLAKALIKKLEEEGKADLIERVIFLATPQIGTPESIGTILHGYDQEELGGLIINDETAREVMRNIPGVYGLIPSDDYEVSASNPFVTFSTTTSLTQIYRTAYGNSVDSINELNNFLAGNLDGRPTATDITQPSKANPSLLVEARAYHDDILDNWIAPEGIEVVEIVGTGLDTIKGFHYERFTERECTLGFINCEVKEYVKPVPLFTQYGDETVTALSAGAYSGEKETYFINLRDLNSEGSSEYIHSNIAGLSEFHRLVTSILKDESTNVEFITEVSSIFNDNRNVISVHSPVRMKVTDGNGNVVEKTGTSTNTEVKTEIPGSSYFEFADGKYIIVPDDIDYTVELKGEGEGSYTLKIDTVVNEDQPVQLSRYELATVTPTMKASFTKENGVFSTIKTDLDGNGTIDSEVTVDGEPVITVYTYSHLREAINVLNISKSKKAMFLIKVGLAEKFAETRKEKMIFTAVEKAILLGIEKQLIQLRKQNQITAVELANIVKILTSIRNS